MGAQSTQSPQWLPILLPCSTPPSSPSRAHFKAAALLWFCFSVFSSHFGSFTPPEQTLLGCSSRRRKGKKAESLPRAAVSGESVVLFYVFVLFFSMLPSPRRAQMWRGADGSFRTGPTAEGEASASCLVPRRAAVPQVSHGFGPDQRQDDVVVLLTLEPVHRRHLHQKKKMSKQATRLANGSCQSQGKLDLRRRFLNRRRACCYCQ